MNKSSTPQIIPPSFLNPKKESKLGTYESFVDRLLGTKSPGWLWAVLLVNGALILFTAKMTLQTFPLFPDEYAYQLSAELFADAKLSVPSPQPSGFFDTLNFVNNGTYYGKYPPGWPVLLALGVRLGLSWLVNPLFGILTLILLYDLARTLFSPALANITMILTFACPFFIFNSACFMSHPSCLLLLTLAAYLILASERVFGSYLVFGMVSGFAFLIRPYTALLVLAPLVLYDIGQAIHRRNYLVIRGYLLGSIPVFAAFFSLFLLYDTIQTGHPFLQPFQVYTPDDRLGFYTHTWKEYSDRLNQNIFGRVRDWVQWTSGMPLLVLVFLGRGKADNPAYQKGLLFAAPALSLLVGYYFYPGPGTYEYGPRYLYESYALMLIPAAMGLLVTRRWVPWILAVIIGLNGFALLKETAYYRNFADDHVKFFDRVNHLTYAIVFIHAANDDASKYFLRNGLNFDGSALLVYDRGPENNEEIIRRFPGRSLYICNFDTSDWDHLLKPYSAKLKE